VPIDTIAIEAVRGIRGEISLSLNAKSLVVRGDNGTGKSSIVQALAWALTGQRGKDFEESWGHVLDSRKSRVVVTLAGGGRIEATEKKVTCDDHATKVRAACQKANPFLMRRQLLGFLEQRPVDRFRYLESFLDLEQADALHGTLTDKARDAESDQEANKSRVTQLLQAVVQRLPRERRANIGSWKAATKEILAWATSPAVGLHVSDWDVLKSQIVALRDLLAGEGLARKRLNLSAALFAFESLATGQRLTPLAPLVSRLAELQATSSGADDVSLLEVAAKHFAQHHDASVCPVCVQQVSANDIRQRIGARLEALRELRSVRAQVEATTELWRERGRVVLAAVSEAATALGISAPDEVPEIPPAPAFTRADWTGSGDAETEQLATLTYFRQHLTTALAELPDEAQAEAQRELLHALEAAAEGELAIGLAEDACVTTGRLAVDLRALAESLRAARQDVASELLDEISGLVGQYYGRIHPAEAPDEVTGKPRIEVQRRSGGTALVRGEFNKREVDNLRGLYSDGHLDTVGICVFLALRRFRATRDGSNDPHLMVLDDIVLSVDLGHARRFLDLLREDFSDHQVLMFTHNGLFFDWCIDRLAGYERAVIQRWTLEAGPLLGNYPSSLERLKVAIGNEASPKLLAQAATNLMDEWLADARFELQLSIPARRGEEYTLTDIWQEFQARLKAAEKKWAEPIGDCSRLLSELKDLPRMRNRLAAHENEFAHEFPVAVVREIASNCVALVESLYCSGCRRFAEYLPNPREPEMIRCRCEGIRYVRPQKEGKRPAAG
jgi:hypothetical protein